MFYEPLYFLLAISLVVAYLLLVAKPPPKRRDMAREIEWAVREGVAESRRLADEAKQDMNACAVEARKRRS